MGLRASGVPRTDQGNNSSGYRKALAEYKLGATGKKNWWANVQLFDDAGLAGAAFDWGYAHLHATPTKLLCKFGWIRLLGR
jgi:hypothetical protein